MSLQDRLNKTKKSLGSSIKTKQGSALSTLRDKFVKRDVTTLEKTYEERDKQTKSGGMGKTIFNVEMLAKYGMEEWQPHQTVGDHFFDVLPVSFKPQVPYHFETCVHFAVGFAKDAFICPHLSHRKPCYRCEQQTKLYRRKDEFLNKGWSEEKFKNVAKRLYAQDRIIYLIWKRTEELLGEEAPDFTIRVWNAPKTAVHQEIQSKVRDKINRTTLDISDISPGGEGRTIAMEVTKKKTSIGTFPQYSSFDLHIRENPIPDEILEQLDLIITDAENDGFNNAIEMFIHYPEYSEIKESMETEEYEDDETPEEESKSNGKTSSLKQRLKGQVEPPEDEQVFNKNQADVDETLARIEKDCLELKEELAKMSSIRFKAWCNKNGYPEALEFPSQIEAIDAIIEDLYEKEINNADINI